MYVPCCRQLSKFAALTEDGVWGVRKACAESFVQVASACSMHTRKTQLVPLFLGLVNDQSRWVSSTTWLWRLSCLSCILLQSRVIITDITDPVRVLGPSQPSSRTTFAKLAFRCTAPAIWNSLPKTVIDSDSITVFKSRLKTFLFSQAYSLPFSHSH